MKKIFWKITLLSCFISAFAYGGWNELGEGEKVEKTLEGNGKLTTARKLILGKNSHLKIKGENTKGIEIKGGFSPEINIGEGATLDIDIENSKKDEAGLTLVSSTRNFTIQKNGNLKLKKRFNGVINSGDIFKQFLDRRGEGTLLRGISVNKKFVTEGNTEIESAGTGIGFDRKTPQGKGEIEFKKGSKTFVKAGFAGVFARYNNVTFEEGSNTTLIGGAYGLMANKGIIQKGAKVTLMGNYGTGKFEVKEHDFLKFESGSELNILANDSALYGIRLKGKTKLIAKGYNVLRQIDTYADGEHSLDTVTFEKGSILDGNIDRSWNSQFLLEEGTKLFVPNKVQANLEIKGDLFIGPRSAYEGKQKTYKEAVEDADTVAGATALLMGKQSQRARKGEFSYRGLYNEFSSDEYYTLEYNRDNHYNYKSTLNLNNGKIHLRLGNKDRFGRINDKIIFSKNTIIKGKGELVFHKRNSSQVTKNTVFNILEEEGLKNINGTQGYYLEKLPLKIPDVSFGQLVFTTKVKKLNGRYVVSLVFKGIDADNFLLAKGQTKTLDKKEDGSLEDAILSAKEVTVEEKSTLNIKGDTNGLFAKNKVTVEEEATLNIETKKDNKTGLKLGENLETFGNINIKNAETGILADNTTSVLKFENGSKTLVNAKNVAVNAQKGSSEFKGGSNVELTSNKYALVAKKAVFEKGSTVKLNGEYGIGTLSETDSSDITFNSQSEVNINSSNSGLYNVNAGGSGKLSIKAPNVLKQVRTVNQSLKFESGSVLEGNIEKSWNANLILDKGSKMFVDSKIEANMDIKGDLFVGTRNSYEKEEGKKTIQTLSTMSSTFSSSDKYYTVHYNKDSNGNKAKVNLDNANIHLRINGEQSESNDKIVFSKDTEIMGKGEITLHPQNSSKIRRNMTFTLLEEEGKDVGGTKVYDLEKLPLTLKKMEFGALVYGRKDKKVNGKYMVTLEDTGELSQAAKNSLTNSRDSYKYNQEELKSISDKIFEKHNLELKNNFWLLVSKENLKNKEENSVNLNQNSRYAGYDYTFNTGVSLGFFAGESTGKNKNIAQGIYLKKDLKPFYLGAIYKHTNSKDKKNDKKFYSNDFSFIAGYNKEIGEKVFVDSNFKLTRGYTSSYDYTAENNLNTRNEKTNYLNGEVNTKLGYKFKYGNAFLKAGLDKDLKGNQKVVWDGNIDEKIKYDDFSKNVGLGMEYKLGNHSLSLELSKKYSKHYRKNTKITFGYSYKF